MADVTMRIWRGDATGGDFENYTISQNEGEVVLDVVHRIQATKRRTWPVDGTARRASAVRARWRSTVSRVSCA